MLYAIITVSTVMKPHYKIMLRGLHEKQCFFHVGLDVNLE